MARFINAMYDLYRKKELRGRAIWRFSIVRANLPQRSDAPASGPFTTWYNVPTDSLRVLTVGNFYPGGDMSDYRQGETDADWSVENNKILCDLGSPIAIKYVSDIQDPTQFDACFVEALGAKLAWVGCDRITSSTEKVKICKDAYKEAMLEARQTNALENIPIFPADDTWILARQQ